MNFGQLLKAGRILSPQVAPRYLIQYVTGVCNARCEMCFYWDNIENADRSKELTLEEFEKIARSYGKLIQLSLTGGEPFLREDLDEICRIFAVHTDPLVVTIPTNALTPDRNYEITKRILTKCPNTFFRFSISLDGVGEQHDKIRGVPGNFEKVKQTYARFDELRKEFKNFNIDMGTTMSHDNQKDVHKTFEWVEQNLKIDNHYFGLARGFARVEETKNVEMENYLDMVRFKRHQMKRGENRPLSRIYRELFERTTEIIHETVTKDRMVLPCVAGRDLIIISERGDVSPCEILGKKVGNVRDHDYDINKVVRAQANRDVVQFIKDTDCHCTFECAINANIAFNPMAWPRLFWNVLRNRQWNP